MPGAPPFFLHFLPYFLYFPTHLKKNSLVGCPHPAGCPGPSHPLTPSSAWHCIRTCTCTCRLDLIDGLICLQCIGPPIKIATIENLKLSPSVVNQSINQSFIKYIRLTKTQSNLQANVKN